MTGRCLWVVQRTAARSNVNCRGRQRQVPLLACPAVLGRVDVVAERRAIGGLAGATRVPLLALSNNKGPAVAGCQLTSPEAARGK